MIAKIEKFFLSYLRVALILVLLIALIIAVFFGFRALLNSSTSERSFNENFQPSSFELDEQALIDALTDQASELEPPPIPTEATEEQQQEEPEPVDEFAEFITAQSQLIIDLFSENYDWLTDQITLEGIENFLYYQLACEGFGGPYADCLNYASQESRNYMTSQVDFYSTLSTSNGFVPRVVVNQVDFRAQGNGVSPSLDAGIRVGDIVESINNETITQSSQILNLINNSTGNVQIVVYRGSERLEFEVIPIEQGRRRFIQLGTSSNAYPLVISQIIHQFNPQEVDENAEDLFWNVLGFYRNSFVSFLDSRSFEYENYLQREQNFYIAESDRVLFARATAAGQGMIALGALGFILLITLIVVFVKIEVNLRSLDRIKGD